ncbi:DUF6090 family protein [Maribacter arcticus]|uniref:Uncharacterized protein n=1 Tax=Maribacter arcticus TaxID=561365 RepID=A0A1T5EJ45_9FLAO|nr:DUF6090 family protein [Maribacter arcticus]SKB83768.1 hypothetical protein SAMN05660866_03518 [Maribacter arcticus]
MIKLFRKIRQRLLTENKFSKYFLYAIGEIVLVVIGILIALQINNWNEWSKDRVKEKEVLVNLAENFELNIEALESDIESLFKFNTSSRIVLNVLDHQQPFADSLAKHFHMARVPKTILSLSQSGYEQYKNMGYGIIIDKPTSREVVDFFESTLPIWFTEYTQVNAPYVPFIDHHVPLFIYKRESLVPINMDQLYKDDYYLGWMRAYMEGRNTLIEIESEFIKENQRVLQLIKDELDD